MCLQIIDVIKCKREETEKKARLRHVAFRIFMPCEKALIEGAPPCEGNTVIFEVKQLLNFVQKTDVEQNKCPVCNKLPGADLVVEGNTIGDIWIHYLYQLERKCYSINRDKERVIGLNVINNVKVQTRPVGWFSFFVDVQQRKPVYKVNRDFKIENTLVEVGGNKHVYEFEEIKDVRFLRFCKEGEELVDEEEK
ncbi:hypothetical protein MMC27_002486 [Xylographa pallens]|nr:hypothetical protein [Xylographa pallens]